jgi:catechol 2,3-dioxygenase-like lactoylglutathione lyase family enzyme
MQLKHLNLTTSDVAGLAAFFERFFAFKRQLEHGSGAFTLMINEEDFVLTLMKAKRRDPAYPETFHVGFYVNDEAAVQAKRDELAAAGLSPSEIRDAESNGRGTHFYCTAPGNVLVEIATPPEFHPS